MSALSSKVYIAGETVLLSAKLPEDDGGLKGMNCRVYDDTGSFIFGVGLAYVGWGLYQDYSSFVMPNVDFVTVIYYSAAEYEQVSEEIFRVDNRNLNVTTLVHQDDVTVIAAEDDEPVVIVVPEEEEEIITEE